MPHEALVVLWALSSVSAPARAEPGAVAPEIAGIVVAPTSPKDAEDLRLGRIAARLARQGLDSVVAIDLARPRPDPEGRLVHARWLLDDARRLRRAGKLGAAAAAGDDAIRLFEHSAFSREHLDLLVEALVERGATALKQQQRDEGTAETVFLKALAISPLHELDPERYDERTLALFSEVRRASRELRYGTLRVEVPSLAEATVAVDFGTPAPAPVTVNLPDGRHFVSISAPARHEVVALVPVRTAREGVVFIRPPPSGDVRRRAEVLDGFKAQDPAAIRALSEVAGLRFVLTTSVGAAAISLALQDGRSGQPVPGATAELSLDPTPDEIDAAVQRIIGAGVVVEPELAGPKETRAWYGTWWGLGLIGAAAIGAATATYLVIQGNAKTSYVFGP